MVLVNKEVLFALAVPLISSAVVNALIKAVLVANKGRNKSTKKEPDDIVKTNLNKRVYFNIVMLLKPLWLTLVFYLCWGLIYKEINYS